MAAPLLLLALLAAGTAADPVPVVLPQEDRGPEVEPPRAARRSPSWPLPDHWLEVTVSSEASFSAAYRSSLGVGGGFGGVGFLYAEDDDWSLDARLMRFGRPGDSAFTLGAGLAAYVVSVDDPSTEGYALAFLGSAEYAFPTSFPTSVGLQTAFAPDVITFDGGDRLFDLTVRLGIEIGSYGRAFVGYRFLQLGLNSGGNEDIENAFHLGVGLAW